MPNAPSSKSIYAYATSIDEIEELTGIDFFYKLEMSLQESIENKKELSQWFLREEL